VKRWGLRIISIFGATMTIVFSLFLASAFAVPPAPTALPRVPGSRDEPNDDPGHASRIASGERIRGDLAPEGDVDYYRFTADAGERVFAAVINAGAAESATDARLTIEDESGTPIEIDDDNGSQSAQSPSIAGAVIPASGTYYLEVDDDGGDEGSTENPYYLYLQLRSGPPASEVEPDPPQSATPIGSGFLSGARNPAGDADFYSMNLEAGDTVFLSLDLDPERDGVTFNGRLGLGLTGDTENQVLVVNDAGASEAPEPTIPSEAMAMTVSEDGTYYAYVDSPEGGVGGPGATYQLSVTVIPGEKPGCRTYSSFSTGDFFDGGMLTYPMTVGDSMRIGRAAVRLDLRQPLMTDLDVSLRNPEGRELALFTDIGSNSAGGEEHMQAVFDDYAAVPLQFPVVRPLMAQTEASRLAWLEGEEAEGQWAVVVRDDEANGLAGSVAEAALILCEQMEQGVAEPIYHAGFESGDEGFVHAGANDQWEHGTPATPEVRTSPPVAGLSTCAEGSACFKTNLDGPYAASSSQDLISPPIALPPGGPFDLTWEQWSQLESAQYDHAAVSVEDVASGHRQPVYTWDGPTMDTFLGNPVVNGNYPEVAGWGLHQADISAEAGRTIRLRFHLDSDPFAQFAGLAVDDISIFRPGTPPAPSTPLGSARVEANLTEQRETPRPTQAQASLTELKIRPERFHAETRGPSLSNKRGGSAGAAIAYDSTPNATVTLSITKHLGGRWKPVASFQRSAVSSRSRVYFTGRVHGHALKPGVYRLAAYAVAAGLLPSRVSEVSFRILP
jgi:subtilisin-like proprotein convertase family protein